VGSASDGCTIGQTREVHIVNLAAAGTIEAYILQLLDRKIKLFELWWAELDLILAIRRAHTSRAGSRNEWLASPENEEDFFFRRRVRRSARHREEQRGRQEQEQLNSSSRGRQRRTLERRFRSCPPRVAATLATGRATSSRRR